MIDKNSTLFPLCDTRTVLNRIPFSELNELVNEPLSDDIVCLDIEDASKGRPSDDQVMMLIKEKTGATNSSAFQQLPAEIKKSVLVELKGRRASLRQLERLTGHYKIPGLFATSFHLMMEQIQAFIIERGRSFEEYQEAKRKKIEAFLKGE